MELVLYLLRCVIYNLSLSLSIYIYMYVYIYIYIYILCGNCGEPLVSPWGYEDGTKLVRSWVGMIRRWYEVGTKLGWDDTKMIRSWYEVGLGWYEVGTKLGWDDTKMIRNWVGLIRRWYEVGLGWYEDDTKLGWYEVETRWMNQISLFGCEIQYFEECMPNLETSGRYLSFGGYEAWSEVHIWCKTRDADWHYNILTVLDNNLAQNRDWAKWPPPKCRSRSEVSFGSLKIVK